MLAYSDEPRGTLNAEVTTMNYEEYLCLTELLDQDLSAYEFFQTLAPEEQTLLRRCSGGIASFSQLQAEAARLRGEGQSFY